MSYKKLSKKNFQYQAKDMAIYITSDLMDNIGLDSYIWETKIQKMIINSVKSWFDCNSGYIELAESEDC